MQAFALLYFAPSFTPPIPRVSPNAPTTPIYLPKPSVSRPSLHIISCATSPPPLPPLPPAYKISSLLTRTPNSTLYRATIPPDPTPLVLKVLSLRSLTSWKSLDLFQREANVLQSLSHPSIPSYVNAFEVDNETDRYFILVQREAPGETIQVLIERGTRFSPGQVREVLERLLKVVEYLSALSPPVLHRDIKPANVVLDFVSDGTVKVNLVDFGGVDGGRVGGATVVGTFGYMAPERLGGGGDLRSDLYSVGATVLSMISGKGPEEWERRRLKVDVGEVMGGLGRLGTVGKVLEKLLEPVMEDRYNNAAEALADLERGGEGFGRGLTEEDRESLDRAFEEMVKRQEKGILGRLSEWAGGKVRRRKPVGTKVVVEKDDGDRLLKVMIPPKGFSGDVVSKGAFAVAWTGFTAIWTVGVLTSGGFFFSLFSIPFWAAGAKMAKSVVDEVGGFGTLLVSFGAGEKELFYFALSERGGFGKLNMIEGDSRDLEYAAVETEMYVNGSPITKLVLREGTKRRVLGNGLDLVEQEWLKDEINDFLQSRWRR